MGEIELDPDALDAYVRASAAMNGRLTEQVDHLIASHNQNIEGVTFGRLDAVSALHALQNFAGLNQQDDQWAASIASLFRELDALQPGRVSEATIRAALERSGFGAERTAVTFDDPIALGHPPTSGYAADPVSTATGHLVDTDADLVVPDALGLLSLPRTYNSRFLRIGALGRGWTTWLDVVAEATDDGTRIVYPDGARVVFPVLAGRHLVTPGVHDRLTSTDEGGLELDRPDGTRWRFDPDGQLRWVTDGLDQVTIDRDGQGRATRLRHARGRAVDLTWLGGRLVSARDDRGRQVTYGYGADGDLVEVRRPGQHLRFATDGEGHLLRAWDADGVLRFDNTYDDEGRVVAQASPFGRTGRFTYLRPGVTVVDDTQGGPATTFVHDPRGRLVSVIDAHGAHQTTHYDDRGDATASTDRSGAVTSRSFDSRGRPIRIEEPGGRVTEVVYDDRGRIVRRRGPDGGEVTLAYEGAARDPVEVSDALGAVATAALEGGRICVLTDPDGAVTRFSRDADGQVVAVAAANGTTTRIRRGDDGEVLDVDPDGGPTTRFTRDPAGHVTSRDVDGLVIAWERSPAGRLLAVTSPTGAVSTFDHGEHGEVTLATDATGVTVEHRYDPGGDLVALVDAQGAAFERRFDALGRLAEIVDPTGRSWRQEHDRLGRVVAQIAPDGTRAEVAYGDGGQVVAATDPTGATRRFAHDPVGRLAAATDPDGSTTTFTYDPAGQRIAATDPDGGEHRWTWTAAGRLASVTGPDGVTRQLRHDVVGRLTAIDGPDGTLQLRRDAHGRVTAVIEADGTQQPVHLDERGRVVGVGAEAPVATLDHAGRPTRITAPDGGVVELAYDPAGRLREQVDPTGGTTTVRHGPTGWPTTLTDPAGGTESYEHDPAGRLRAITDALGRRTEFHHDAVGRLAGWRDPDDRETALHRDDVGRVVGVTGRDGERVDIELDAEGRLRSIGAGRRRVAVDYDEAGRLRTWERDGQATGHRHLGDRLEVTGPTGAVTRHHLDAHGRLLAIEDERAGRGTVTRDDRGQATRFVAPDVERRWWWDAAGQLERLVQQVDGRAHETRVERGADGRVVAVVQDDARTELRRDAAGQLTEVRSPDGTAWSFAYVHGRRVRDLAPDGRERQFRYDATGQLVAVETADGTVQLTYDLQGRRSEVHRPDGTVVRYRWHPSGQLAAVETTDADGRVQLTTLEVDAAGDLSAVDGLRVDWDRTGPWPVVSRVGSTRVVGRGAPLAVVDAEGRARWLRRDVFGTCGDVPLSVSVGLEPGVATPLEGPVGLGMRGELTVAGLVWCRARVYDPEFGVFLSRDPVPPPRGSGQAANVYHYAANDPISHVDPWGLSALTDADLAAFNDVHTRHLGTRMADGAVRLWNDPGGWWDDHWGAVAATGVLLVGAALLFTPAAPIGLGIIGGVAFEGVLGATSGEDGRDTRSEDVKQAVVCAVQGRTQRTRR